jgi:hypothetical protein
MWCVFKGFQPLKEGRVERKTLTKPQPTARQGYAFVLDFGTNPGSTVPHRVVITIH